MELRPHIQLPQQHVCSQGGPGHDTGLFGLPADRTNIMQAVERGTSRNFDGSRRPLWPVKLKVFDISKGMAELYGGFFVSDKKKGIWHTNVVVFGLEYFYVSTICVCPVGMGWPGEEQLKEVLDMGTTERTVFELEAFLRAQQRVFTPNKYDMFKHNCNHFSDLVLRFLNYRLRVPSYIASLPERVLQTTLGRLVYPLVNAALDRTKSEICQHADKAELCGEIFFYGGATPLLLPGERSTRALVKRVMEEFKQQQRETVAHRSSIATCRSKSSSRSGQCSQGSAFFGSRSTSQNAAAVTAAYSDAVIARRRERTRYLNDEDSRWSSQHRHGEVQRQRQQRQQQTRHLQWQPDYVVKKRAQSGSTALGRGVSSRHTTAAAGDDLPAATDEALPYAVGEEFFTLGEADSHGEEQTDYEAPPMAIKEAEELPHWEDNRSSSSAWHQPPRRERSHLSAVHSAGGAKANDTEQPEETQGGGQALWGSSSGSDSKYLCQWKSHADFLHATDDTSSSTAGAGPAGEAQYKTKRPARRLRGVTSVAWSDCSTSSEASRPRTSLACGTSGERVCRRVGTRVVGPLTTATSIREEELPFCDAFESRNKDSSWSPITGSLLRLVDRAHQRGPGARPNSRSARRGKYGSSNSRQAPELRGTPTENAPPMTVSSSSTTVDSRLSTYSGTSPSSSNTYARKGLERHFSTRNNASFGEDPRAGDRSNYAPAQSVQVRDQQRTSGAGNVAAVLRYRTSASPSAARDTHRARRRSVSETNSSTLPSARDLWKCVAGDDSADVEPLRFSRTDSGIRRCSSGWRRRNNCEYEPGDAVCGSRRPPFSRRHHSLSAPTSIGAGENKVDLDEEEQNRSCGTRRHIITSGVLAPVEGDIAAEDVHGSTQSSNYSSFSEAHDSCDDSVAQPVQRWLGEREEVQYEQNDQTQARQAEQQDYRRNNEKQNLFVTSPEGRRTSLAAGRTCLGSPFSSLHASSASSGIFEPHPRVDGQKSVLQSNIQRVPTAGSSSCSYIESADVVGREERLAAGRVGESFSATADEVDFSGPHSNVPVCEAAVPDPAAADESEPVWQDAEEEEEAETKDSREDRGQSEYSKEWLSAGPTRPAGIKAEAGKTSERRGVHPSELSPSDFNDALHLSASTAPPVSKYSSFESASDCCFLESAHEDDSEEEEGGQTFQEAKEERTGSDETAGSSRNKEKRAADRRQWRDWWHQQEQQHERNAACSPSVTTEVQQPKKGVSQRLLCDRFKQTDDLEVLRLFYLHTMLQKRFCLPAPAVGATNYASSGKPK